MEPSCASKGTYEVITRKFTQQNRSKSAPKNPPWSPRVPTSLGAKPARILWKSTKIRLATAPQTAVAASGLSVSGVVLVPVGRPFPPTSRATAFTWLLCSPSLAPLPPTKPRFRLGTAKGLVRLYNYISRFKQSAQCPHHPSGRRTDCCDRTYCPRLALLPLHVIDTSVTLPRRVMSVP